MLQFVLLEDSYQDAQIIKNSLAQLKPLLPHNLLHYADLSDGLTYIKKQPVDLLLLDLEFTVANRTAVSVIDDIPNTIPILIVSHLTHYQKPLSMKMNVKGFINKENISSSLVPSIKKIYGLEAHEHEHAKDLIFPASKNSHISEAVPVRDIRYIDFHNRKEYTIHLVDGTSKTIQSIPFRELCQLIVKQKIDSLCPVNKNQIINVDYIKSVKKMDNCRLEVELVNLPRLKFHVGPKHQQPFEVFSTK